MDWERPSAELYYFGEKFLECLERGLLDGISFHFLKFPSIWNVLRFSRPPELPCQPFQTLGSRNFSSAYSNKYGH